MNATSDPAILAQPVAPVRSEADQQRLIRTMVRAFQADPAVRWLFPQEDSYAGAFSALVRAFGAKAFEGGNAFQIQRFSGASLWIAPEVKVEDEPVIEVMERFVPAQRLGDAFAVFGQMDEYHPDFAHWYLPFIGVLPERQGRGLGSALLRHVLDECDGHGMPAYLESSSPMNLPLYERYGFRVIGEIQAGFSPVIYPMLRDPLPVQSS